MAQAKALARALLIAFLLLGLAAAPAALTFSWANAASASSLLGATARVADVAPEPLDAPKTSGREFSVAPAGPLRVPADDIVISEFRSRGPSTNSHETDEFIELFNPSTDTPVLIDGWSLWRSDCFGGASRIEPLHPLDPHILAGVTLGARKHYLIGGLNYSGAVPADISTDIGLADVDPDGSLRGGGLALRSGQLSTDPIIDQVGNCGTPSYFEGTPLPDPLRSNSDQSYDRNSDIGGSCVDTDNNAADFSLRSPSDPQNSASPLTTCGNPMLTPTNTATSTPTNTATSTRTPTLTITPLGFRPRVMISEVGWAGTSFSDQDQWIELHNPTDQVQSLGGWLLETSNGSMSVYLSGSIQPHEWYLLVHGTNAQLTATPAPSTPAGCLVFNMADVAYDKIFTGTLSQTGQILYLINPQTGIEDSADRSGGVWPAGQLSPPKSMERSGDNVSDTTSGAWFTFEGDTASTPRDCNNSRVRGTPRASNWSFLVTRTPSPTPAPTRKPTARPPTPFAHMVINEFLPRAGTDWNQDGEVNVYDEFIEVKNLGPIDVDLKGWKLDDEADRGSAPFILPSLKLKPEQRALFYGAATGILLDDSGDSVRLINARGIVIDARTYGPVADPDQSHCRIPDGYYWRRPCFPTPGLENSLTGSAPAPPPAAASHPPPCLLADTVPDAIRQAECAPYGDDMWSRTYWDDLAGRAQFPVPDLYSKWKTIVE